MTSLKIEAEAFKETRKENRRECLQPGRPAGPCKRRADQWGQTRPRRAGRRRRRCASSACAVLTASEVIPALASRSVLGDLGCEHEIEALDAEIVKEVKNAEAVADGKAGDSVKYLAAAE